MRIPPTPRPTTMNQQQPKVVRVKIQQGRGGSLEGMTLLHGSTRSVLDMSCCEEHAESRHRSKMQIFEDHLRDDQEALRFYTPQRVQATGEKVANLKKSIADTKALLQENSIRCRHA